MDVGRLTIEMAAQLGIEISQEQGGKFQTYFDMLTDWNTRMNLTAITQPQEVAGKHFVDSLLPLYLNMPDRGASVIDVGTGAGFPGLPLKLVRQDIRLTLLDSLNKRLLFLQALCAELELEAEFVHARAEEGGRNGDLRERFDVVLSRAVAPFQVLAELTLPFCRVGGICLCYKGPDALMEVDRGQRAVRLLGGRVEGVERFVTQWGERGLVVVKKVAATPARFPRRAGEPGREPL